MGFLIEIIWMQKALTWGGAGLLRCIQIEILEIKGESYEEITNFYDFSDGWYGSLW